MTVQLQSPTWTKAKELRDAGYGYEDLMVKCNLTEAEARLFVFGRYFYNRWAMRRKAK